MSLTWVHYISVLEIALWTTWVCVPRNIYIAPSTAVYRSQPTGIKVLLFSNLFYNIGNHIECFYSSNGWEHLRTFYSSLWVMSAGEVQIERMKHQIFYTTFTLETSWNQQNLHHTKNDMHQTTLLNSNSHYIEYGSNAKKICILS